MRVTGTQIFKDAISYFLENIRGILLTAAIPALIGVALALMLSHAQTETMLQQLRDGVPPAKLNPFSVKVVLIGLAAWIVGLWFSVRVYRYRLSQEFPVRGSELDGVVWTIAYLLLVVVMLIMLVIALVFVAALVIGLVSLALGVKPDGGAPTPQMAMIGLLMFLVIVPAYFYAIYAAFRFTIAFPGIAIGRREHIFRTMWPMARGVALPLLAWFILMGLGVLLILALVIYTTVGFAVVFPLPEMYQRMLEDPSGFFRLQLAAGVILAIPNVLFKAFGATAVAEAYAQLNRGRNVAPEQIARVETPQDGGWQ